MTRVKFHGDQADAVVSFAPKGGKISDGLTMRYQLEQRDNEWVITGRSALNMRQHTGGNAVASVHDGSELRCSLARILASLVPRRFPLVTRL